MLNTIFFLIELTVAPNQNKRNEIMKQPNLDVVRMNVAADLLKLHAKLEAAFTVRNKCGKDRTAIAAIVDARNSLLAVVDD